MKDFVVIHDPVGKLPEGKVLTGNAVAVAKSRGVVILPVEPDLIPRSAFAGWAKRCYGDGEHFAQMQSSRGCALALHAHPDFPTLHWAARIVPFAPHIEGSLRIASDTAQLHSLACGIAPITSPVVLDKLGEEDAQGGWTVYGAAKATIPGDAYIAVQLYGMMTGARVAWFAISQSA
jgi:hypothetical protein